MKNSIHHTQQSFYDHFQILYMPAQSYFFVTNLHSLETWEFENDSEMKKEYHKYGATGVIALMTHRELFRSKYIKDPLEETAQTMISSLKRRAKEKGISEESIRSIFHPADAISLSSLDTLFRDDGETRTEHFCILAHTYAKQFGDAQSDEYLERLWEAEKIAMACF